MARLEITIHPFILQQKQEQSLFPVNIAELLRELHNTPRENRSIPFDYRDTSYIQLIDINECADGIFLLNFNRLRMNNGPARGNLAGELTSFDLNDDEGFGEEAAALFDPETNAFIVQFNHFSVSATRMAEFVQEFNPSTISNYDLIPILRQDVLAVLRRQKMIKQISFTTCPAWLSDEDIKSNNALSSSLRDQSMRDFGGNLTIVMQAAPNDELRGMKQPLISLVGLAAGWKGLKKKAISKISISGKEDDDKKLETLDLLNARVSTKISVNTGSDKRVPKEERWRALRQAYMQWKPEFYNIP